jgi:hypothetical protein
VNGPVRGADGRTFDVDAEGNDLPRPVVFRTGDRVRHRQEPGVVLTVAVTRERSIEFTDGSGVLATGEIDLVEAVEYPSERGAIVVLTSADVAVFRACAEATEYGSSTAVNLVHHVVARADGRAVTCGPR